MPRHFDEQDWKQVKWCKPKPPSGPTQITTPGAKNLHDVEKAEVGHLSTVTKTEGKAIARLRLKKCLTQAQLASAVGVRQGVIQACELGRAQRDHALMQRLRVKLGKLV